MLRPAINAVMACAILAATACTPTADNSTDDPANGSAFGVILHAPPDWRVASAEELRDMRKTGADALLGDHLELRRMAEASQQARTVIFAAFRYGPDAVVDYNPSVYASAANVGQAPDITARRYLKDTITTARALGAEMVVDGDFRKREIDGHAFDSAKIHLEIDGSLITQEYYGARHGDDMINIIQSYAYGDEAQRAETYKLVSSIELDW